jgi:putative SOS response-associated peptidase YedK
MRRGEVGLDPVLVERRAQNEVPQQQCHGRDRRQQAVIPLGVQVRCIVSADGFYEWEEAGKEKLPWLFSMQQLIDGDRIEPAPMPMAGLYETWRGLVDGIETEILSTTIITTPTNDLVGKIHDRMPVILPEESVEAWLDPKKSATDLKALIQPLPAEMMVAWRVYTKMNKTAYSEPDCVQAV